MKKYLSFLVCLGALSFSLMAPSKVMAAGVTAFSIGASSGTNLVVLSAVPRSFWGVDVTSGTTGDLFKCWNATSGSGLTIASGPTLGGTQYGASSSAARGPAQVPVDASVGVVCAKNSASAEFIVYLTAP